MPYESASAQVVEATTADRRPDALPATIQRVHVENCLLPENAFAFDLMSDYLAMMSILGKTIAHALESSAALTPLQFRILLHLYLAQGPMLTKELAGDLNVGVSTISTAVGKLAERGAVERSESARDMRAVEHTLTPSGRRLLSRADKATAALVTEYLGTLTREQASATMESSLSTIERHSRTRIENGEPRMDTVIVESVMISRALTLHALQSQGLTTRDYRVLLALKVTGGSLASAELAKFLFLSPSDITSSLKNLEAMGYLTRERLASNRRVRVVTLTDSGRERIAALMPLVFDALHEACHSDEALISIHTTKARDIVERKRRRELF